MRIKKKLFCDAVNSALFSCYDTIFICDMRIAPKMYGYTHCATTANNYFAAKGAHSVYPKNASGKRRTKA